MKNILSIIISILVIAGVIYLLIHFNIFGKLGLSEKNKSKDTTASVTTENNTEVTTESKTEENIAEITVSGHDYIFNNEKISLDTLAEEIGKLDKNKKISISYDDTAAKNTLDELTDKLDELGFKNYEKNMK